HPLKQERPRLRCLVANRRDFAIRGRVPELLRSLHARKLDDRDSASRRLSFEDFHLAAARDKSATERLDECRRFWGVLLHRLRIGDLNVHDDVRWGSALCVEDCCCGGWAPDRAAEPGGGQTV